MRYLFLCLLCIILSGCGVSPWIQSKVLSGADTKQAIALEESQDVKTCDFVHGQGSYLSVSGIVQRLRASGKNVSFQDCLNFMNKTSSPIVLPASRPPIERPLPPENP